MHHNHSDLFGKKLFDCLPQNKTRGLTFFPFQAYGQYALKLKAQ